MQMIRMVSIQQHQYAGRRLHAGDEFDCEEQHLDLMRKMGWARRVMVSSQEARLIEKLEWDEKDVSKTFHARPTYQTRDMAAAPRTMRKKKK